MTETNWSPADNPYAIAVSEAMWWQRSVRLCVVRMQDDDDRRIAWVSSWQIDARQLIFALQQVLRAAELESVALEALGMDASALEALSVARQQFETDLPGIGDMRDGLIHFDEWSRGVGRGPQKAKAKEGMAHRDVARLYWGLATIPAPARSIQGCSTS